MLAETGAAKVDIVGHSEGGFQSLYVTKTQGIASHIDKVVAIAPPTHGTTFAGLYNLAYVFGQSERRWSARPFATFGCPACSDLGTGGAAVRRSTTGRSPSPASSYTIITSRYDELVTPTDTAFVASPASRTSTSRTPAPIDPVGHIGEAYDLNVWRPGRERARPGERKAVLLHRRISRLTMRHQPFG